MAESRESDIFAFHTDHLERAERMADLMRDGHGNAELTDTQEDEAEQCALFTIEGPDDDGCVWLVSGEGPSAIVVNLGPREPVATRLAEWLAEIDFGEGAGDDGN